MSVEQIQMTMFENVTDARELIGQAIGAGSLCWVGGTGNLEFDSTTATEIADAAYQQLQKILAGLFVDHLRPTTITTVDELDALPAFSLVKSTNTDRDDDVWIKSPDDGDWYWWAYDFGYPASGVPLPATVLYTPGGER